MKSKVSRFFFHHQVFSYNEFINAMGNPAATCRAMLAQHIKRNNIIPIKRGLYAAVPAGAEAVNYPIDPYLIMNACAQDAVVAYHSAIQFHGCAHSTHFDYIFLSGRQLRPFQFRNDRFIAHRYPSSLSKCDAQMLVETIDYHGYDIKVTNITRTVVDVLDRINLSGGLEEIWRSLRLITFIDVNQAINYALQLKNKTTIAKIGYYLSYRKKDWSVSNEQLDKLKKFLPAHAHYMHRSHRINGVLIKEWQLIVPEQLLNDQWDEEFDVGG